MTNAFTLLLDDYLARLDGGETFQWAELERDHPQDAKALWEKLEAWKKVAVALPGSPGGSVASPAIHFQSLSLGADADEIPTRFASPDELSKRFAKRSANIQRYKVVEELARGAMGAIVRVTDTDLGRDLAMKVMLARTTVGKDGVMRRVPPAAVARFVEEARITGRLEHPGIPTVHDFGVDSEGNFYFTMPWVRGETLGDVLASERQGQSGWDRTRVLGLIVQVCDALGYAHSEQVIHRDIKPRNVMVGEFGEVLVMDWGLARDRAGKEAPDVHLATPDGEDATPVMTRDGVVIGTPCYMSPEQAHGDVYRIGPQTDVYAVGAMLYELLIGHPPYAGIGSKTPAHGIVRMVQQGPPPEALADKHDVPPELVAICQRAMAREKEDRFADVGALGRELRAFLEGRVVASYATGAWVEFRKWVGRNRWVAALAASLLLVSAVGVLRVASVERARRLDTERELEVKLASELLLAAEELGPISAEYVEVREDWLASAKRLFETLAQQEMLLAAFESEHSGAARKAISIPDPLLVQQAESYRGTLLGLWGDLLPKKVSALTDPAMSKFTDRNLLKIDAWQYELPRLNTEVARYDWERANLRASGYEDALLDRDHAYLWNHTQNIKRLGHPTEGAALVVEKELRLARNLAEKTIVDFATEWEIAIGSIQDASSCPLYEGFALAPQVGLVPLGRNEAGLWEFWHHLSGGQPEVNGDAIYEITPETGMVFILVPGGSRFIGAQSSDSEGANFVSSDLLKSGRLSPEEDPVRAPLLTPFFMSKYEMTQAQWFRLVGRNSSTRYSGTSLSNGEVMLPTNPVENLSRTECLDALGLWGLGLPTEAQWEVAARASTSWAYWWGNVWPPPPSSSNFYDKTLRIGRGEKGIEDLANDGFAYHVPVDTFGQNPWGFHHILGNVSEWCRDWYGDNCSTAELVSETGELIPNYSDRGVVRGGSYRSYGEYHRVSRRESVALGGRGFDTGVRPVVSVIEKR
ncbi:MAG: sulfatase activating formylglycine-generating enzyme [Planctomycetota bacterium]|jgi:formylglycine-generating enzyme required for sulfatase activity